MSASPELARIVAQQLAQHVTDVVLCPGSRNSPLSLALLARRDLRVHTRIDERSAAFLALGIGRASGRHAAVVTTSGTAVANCAPAITEAAHAHVPLIVLSADRPRRLVGTGASQTIEQVGIFSTVVETTQIAAPEDIALIAEAVKRPAVHLNVALDTPLVDSELPEPEGQPVAATRRSPVSLHVDHGEATLDISKDTLVIAGDEAWEVEGLEYVPTLAEPSAPAPFEPVHPLAAGLFARGEISVDGSSDYAEYVARTKPEQIVVVGHPTLHRSVLALMSDPSIDVTTLTRSETVTDPAGVSRRVASRVKVTGQPRKQWLNVCRGLSETAAEAVRTVLADEQFGFTGVHAAAAVADGLGVGDSFVLGASNPVRDAALVGLPFGGVDVYAPRGAAGIDGTVSQAIGIALATQSADPEAVRAPRTIALMGDVTFLHDIGGLLVSPDQPAPENLTIVVANDDGCGIFESLEVGQDSLRPSFERAFGTPHGVDLEAACAAYGVNYVLAGDLKELITAVEQAAEEPVGIQVIEAKTTRTTRRALDGALKKAMGL
ncbi:2-succinyl-5-enolpyruvyl-6-hydroxy-3-cyclohexene-1-carboxylic-acid synthase [Corynebacterium tapiri]|uniref:2-succinyl-5-enolpyruvyl-6-hydroxy-3-cyclohexene-1-carboxylate synthase n=1 Tax=Corynebacterium tapiri TaxID=1448266 RepID=A0A5C4U2S9_9CORY|nr:2-succinyl-5-enolpyruvyl-6-hydroxy-3-cyclohexene-1-carboxylic-acid synthase [Corynebacterium tapiri]TNL97274.1 2-succinyl-5-enolpyruvyl-6-hydroxy-3-cyclohexene-1-carboxylic-acid synthase [Corynebacterium tapiri]